MLKYIVIVICLFCNPLQAAVSIKQTIEVYKKLVLISSIKNNPPLYIVNSNQIQAATNGKSVMITRGMLRFLKNKNELAVVLGHELTHYILQSSKVIGNHNEEYRADHGGLYLASKLNPKFNKIRTLGLFKRFKRTLGNYDSNSHPAWSKRYNKLNKL